MSLSREDGAGTGASLLQQQLLPQAPPSGTGATVRRRHHPTASAAGGGGTITATPALDRAALERVLLPQRHPRARHRDSSDVSSDDGGCERYDADADFDADEEGTALSPATGSGGGGSAPASAASGRGGDRGKGSSRSIPRSSAAFVAGGAPRSDAAASALLAHASFYAEAASEGILLDEGRAGGAGGGSNTSGGHLAGSVSGLVRALAHSRGRFTDGAVAVPSASPTGTTPRASPTAISVDDDDGVGGRYDVESGGRDVTAGDADGATSVQPRRPPPQPRLAPDAAPAAAPSGRRPGRRRHSSAEGYVGGGSSRRLTTSTMDADPADGEYAAEHYATYGVVPPAEGGGVVALPPSAPPVPGQQR